MNKEKIKNEAGTERSILWNKIYEKVKQLPIANVEGDAVDHISLSYTLEELFNKLSQPKDIESLREEFFKEFGEQSFRGYPLEQCNIIWHFFLPHLHPKEQPKESELFEFSEWYNDNDFGYGDKGYGCWRLRIPYDLSQKQVYELYQEYLKTKQ